MESKLEQIKKNYSTRLGIVKSFVKESKKEILQKKKEIFGEHSEEDLRTTMEELLKSKDESEILKSIEGKVESNPKKVYNAVKALIDYLPKSSMLAEMTLTYIIIVEEAFLKDYIKSIFTSDSRILKSRQREITYEKIFEFESMDDLISYLSRREVDDKIGREDIDEVADYIKERFNVDITEFSDWLDLREAYFRRNIIVHNDGKVNKTYLDKIGGEKGEKLDTKMDYVENKLENLDDFIGFFHKNMSEKLEDN